MSYCRGEMVTAPTKCATTAYAEAVTSGEIMAGRLVTPAILGRPEGITSLLAVLALDTLKTT